MADELERIPEDRNTNNEPDVPGIPEDLWHMRNCDALVDPMEGDCTCGLAERKIIVLLENECRVKRDVIGAQLAQLATLRTENAALEAENSRLKDALKKYEDVRDGYGVISANLALGIPCKHDFRCHDPGDQGDGCLHDDKGRTKHECIHCGITVARAALTEAAALEPEEKS